MARFGRGLTDDEAKICDTNLTNCHPLTSGVIVEGGSGIPAEVIGILSDRDCPVTAAFISEDEAVYLPASKPTSAPGTAAGTFTWTFHWDEVPVLGCNATLRIMELCGDSAGTTLNYIVHVVIDADADSPCSELP